MEKNGAVSECTDPLDKRKRLKAGWAEEYLRTHPDGNGLLLPRMKEEIRKDEAWRTILGPTHDAVQVVGKGGWKDAVAHGLAEYWAKVAFAAGGVDPKHAYLSGARSITPKMHDKKRYETLEHHLFEEENISENMDYIYDSARRWGIPPETAKKLAAAYPDFLRAAIALSNVAERAYEYGYGKEAHKKFLQGILKPSEIDALIEIMESKITPPHYLVKKFARPEELETIYKVHKRFLDMFPHLFEEKKTPFEELIPEERRKELDEIIELENKLAEGVIQKKLLAEYILPERKERRLVQLKKEHYLDALRKLGLIAGEKKMQQMTGKPVAAFEDRALAEEYASLKGGKVVQTPDGKYAVVVEEVNAGKPVAIFDDRVLAEDFASLKGGKVIQTPEGRYAVVIEERAEHPPAHERPVGRASSRPSKPKTRAETPSRPSHDRNDVQTPKEKRETVKRDGQLNSRHKKRHWVEEVLGIPADQIKRHPGTGYEYVEKDRKIVVLPHDDPRKLGLKGPDSLGDKLEQTFIPYTIMYSRDPLGEIRALARAYKEVVDGVMSGRIKSIVEIERYGRMKGREFKEKGYKRAKEFAKGIGKSGMPSQKDVQLDRLVEEYRCAALMLHDVAELTEEILKHPEKHGIDPKRSESEKKRRIAYLVSLEIEGKYLGFHKS
ncbi:hypothetical protein [Thermococcus sp.]